METVNSVFIRIYSRLISVGVNSTLQGFFFCCSVQTHIICLILWYVFIVFITALIGEGGGEDARILSILGIVILTICAHYCASWSQVETEA